MTAAHPAGAHQRTGRRAVRRRSSCARDKASFVTGAALSVDGGNSIGTFEPGDRSTRRRKRTAGAMTGARARSTSAIDLDRRDRRGGAWSTASRSRWRRRDPGAGRRDPAAASRSPRWRCSACCPTAARLAGGAALLDGADLAAPRRERDAQGARQPRRDHLPGPDRLARSADDGRRPARRGATRASRRSTREARRAGARDAGGGRHRRGGAAARPVPVRALRRHVPARDDRDRARRAARAC